MLHKMAVSIFKRCIALAILVLVAWPVAMVSLPANAQSKSLLKVRISRLPIAPYVPADVAMSRGWFKEAGLDVVVGAIAGGAVSMQALIGGRLDIVFGSLDAAIKARGQGFDAVIVSNNNIAAMSGKDAGAILVRNDSGIRKVTDLVGKRVLVNNLQNINWAYTREAVRMAGGDPTKIHFLEVPFPSMVDALLGGRADAASVTEPFTTIGASTGKLKILTHMFVDIQPGLNIAGWIARESWIRQHPQAVAAFKGTLQRAMDFLENPDERKKAILKFTRLKAGLLSRIKLDKWTTKLDPRDLEKQLMIYKRHGMIDKLYDVNILIAR